MHVSRRDESIGGVVVRGDHMIVIVRRQQTCNKF
jgi:hypothetical protein